MRKSANQKLAIGTIGGALLVFIVGYVALISPHRSEASRLSTQIADVRSQIVARRVVQRPSNLQAIRIADLFRLARAMPSSSDMPDIVLQLSKVASQTGITLESITPGAPIAAGVYQKIPITLAFEGRFYDLSDFLYRLRNLVDVHNGTLTVGGRLFSVDSISFGESDDAKFPLVSARLNVDAYVYSDPTVPGAVGGVGASPAVGSAPATGSTPAASGATAASAGATG